jgi:hypothetical protein
MVFHTIKLPNVSVHKIEKLSVVDFSPISTVINPFNSIKLAISSNSLKTRLFNANTGGIP